ncbi:Formyltransferase [Choiromyces venosus 120613-1]|uniref:methionyl-tRNA formyltransferase n=1 Tax=Choiromyces venosus 120613-1 TaxID=1336337 RepID=A0A3N4IYK1_9PEZI|nr:Formyltransferase [Choiromyces venosus 120613-1]
MRPLLRCLVSFGGHIHYHGSLYSLSLGTFPPCSLRTSPSHCRSVSTESPIREPLRILFCGSDHFSATSLKALHNEHLSNGDLIRSIDVLTLEDKRSGRGMKTIREVPVKNLAKLLSLPRHELYNFGSDWNLPDNIFGEKINMLIAVSFGLFIPAQLIKDAKYGGLNVHPSLLPMYRGAAPIYHTLLDQQPITGVSVQTLHPRKFDHGEILLQTNPPINVPPKTGYQDLHATLAVHGAELLVETLRRGLFVPPLNPIKNDYKPSLAHKIDPQIHARIDWNLQDAEEIERRCGTFNTMWCKLSSLEDPELERRKRAILSDISVYERPEMDPKKTKIQPGTFRHLSMRNKDGSDPREVMIVKCRKGGGWISVGGVKVEGKGLVSAPEWARSILAQKGKGGKIFT